MNCASKNCKREVKFEISYDVGVDVHDLALCKYHYNKDPIFKKYIKKFQEL